MNIKTIVQVWQYEYANYRGHFWGIGDLIKGTISIRNYCRINNYKYVLDIHKHDISKFVKYNNTTYSNKIDDLGSSIPFCVSIEDIEKTMGEDSIFFCNSNVGTVNHVNEEDKQFIRELFVLKDEYEEEYTKNYISGKYTILHYRLGDRDMLSNVLSTLHEKVYKHILDNSNSNTIVCTDNQQLKNIINKNQQKTSICHLGQKSSEDCVKYTLYDLILISRSNLIKTYTIYTWTSGFCVWVSRCYNIPIEGISL